ncbi:hypothetical protein K2X05_13500 [bacterium]|nr:hypothetical protein [bacterium]
MSFSGLSLLLLLNLLFSASSFAKEANNKVIRRYLFGFGPTSYSNLNSRGLGTIFSGGYIWNLDPQFDLIAAADFGISFKHNDVRLFCPQLKGRYMFNDDPESNSSWYAGGGLGAGYARNHETSSFPPDSIVSLAVSAAFGVKFYRKTPMPLFIEIEHLMYLRESAYGTPISTSIKVGVAFPEGKSRK